MSEAYSTLMKETYARRASTYDDSIGGYHIDLAQDLVQLISPSLGEVILDVSCGTGRVKIGIANRIGVGGAAVAADWSPEMQAVGKVKVSAHLASSKANDLAEIECILEDITSKTLLERDSVGTVAEEHGEFDVVSMCQGYMQLSDVQGALRF